MHVQRSMPGTHCWGGVWKVSTPDHIAVLDGERSKEQLAIKSYEGIAKEELASQTSWEDVSGTHLQVVQGVRLEHTEERLLPLFETELRVLRERAVDVPRYDVIRLLLHQFQAGRS